MPPRTGRAWPASRPRSRETGVRHACRRGREPRFLVMSEVVVRVRVGTEDYALPVENVLEVAELGALTPVPGSARTVLGVRNLRGQVIPVIDLAGFFEIESSGEPTR